MKKHNLRIVAALAAVLLCLTVLSLTAYAEGGDYYADELPVETAEPTEAPAPEASPEPAFTPEGNLSLIDDIPYQNKQFITVQSKSGNTFYIIIDRAADSENVYFLNEVDEADLLALMDEPESEPAPALAVCTCKDKCYAGHVDTSCPVCAVNMSECTGKEKKPLTTPSPEVTEPEPEPEKKPRTVNPAIPLLLLLALGGGAAWYFLKVRGKAKPRTKGAADLNTYDYGTADDEEYEFERYEPEEAEAGGEESDD